ncbi:hypothetical protein BU26DRAFT_557142 [Trematosphaeria pertusa]|uniref:Rhodopsin domain-containing protein n=1 Tax=Trematosphaeria pertusa TaxID=390896 RepID=A0A6A6J2F0_9PLEO|nr:uncharacterized protein BU26DRAFT_557142 [Trematosphaeria pertusa]KAF2255633.1 hypothetical protein BU26DRAFT_557142 [Trematosphaeria pertusa]
MSATSTPLPAGITPPYAAINDHDQSGLIAILAGFSLGLVLLSAGIRMYARRYSGDYRIDDYTIFAAVGFAIIQSSLVFYEVAVGLGKEWTDLEVDQLVKIRKSVLASDLFYIIVLFCSKASCGFFLLWLTPYKTHRKLVWGLIATEIVWVTTSLFVEGFRCPGRNLMEHATRCTGFFARWVYVGVFDMLIEVALIVTSSCLVWSRQMTRRQKYVVVGAFACRIPNIILTIIRLVFLSEPIVASTSDFWNARVSSVTQIAIGYTVTACVVPYLRPLVQAYEPGIGRRQSREPSFKLSERSSRGSQGGSGARSRHRSENLRSPVDKMRAEEIGNKELACVATKEKSKSAAKKGKRDIGTEESPGLVIKKAVDWTVTHHHVDHKQSIAVPPEQRDDSPVSPRQAKEGFSFV